MNAKETKERGIAYCKRHRDETVGYYCVNCPLRNEVCINRYGSFKMRFLDDFESLAESFNIMIKEIYKDDNSNDGTNDSK